MTATKFPLFFDIISQRRFLSAPMGRQATLLLSCFAFSCAGVRAGAGTGKQPHSAVDASGQESIGKNESGPVCQAVTPLAPDLEAAVPNNYPKSRLRILAKVPLSSIHNKIAGQIPTTLAAEKDRPVGAPGLASFTVRRGSPYLRDNGNSLSVFVPIFADISVCKPIGSGCFKYGSCSPELEASFSLQNTLGPAYSLLPPRGTIRATKSCVIGLDVTSQIESIAQGEVKKIESQIRRQWPNIEGLVESSWKELSRPIALTEDSCFHFSPDAISYVRPKISSGTRSTESENKNLTFALELGGTLNPSPTCSTDEPVGPLSDAQLKKSLTKKSELWIPELISEEQLKAALDAGISGKLPSDAGSVKMRELRLGKKRIALLLDLEGTLCGNLWVSAAFTHKLGAESLTLSDWTISTGSGAPQALGKNEKLLLAHLANAAKVPLTSALWFTEDQKGRLKTELTRVLPSSLKFEIEGLAVNQARTTGTIDGLRLLHPLGAEVSIVDF